ncbi:MAG TPA: DUF3566 domain-containing protein [Blastococcus sp.]|nr:DUF3566 domain-containing protein [Blastococcus sp.]
MSDRTPSSVRTEPREGDGAVPEGNAPAEPVSVTSTQSIPTTGSMRAQSAGAATTGPTATTVTGGPVGAPPVPPPTGASAAVPPATAAADARSGDAAAPSGRGSRGRGRSGRGPRRARLQLRHIDTWSALKISLVLSIALFFIWMVAVAILYGVLSALGVFDTLNDLFGQLGTASGSEGGGGDVVTIGVVFWGAAVIGAINVVLMTALCTVGTFIYNLCADLVGGLELTLSERD